jgi:cell division septation protein DedD
MNPYGCTAKTGDERERPMAVLKAVLMCIRRTATGDRYVGSSVYETAADDGMPKRRRHTTPRRFFRFMPPVLSMLFFVALLSAGCEGESASDGASEGRLVITDDEILFTIPRESPDEPFTAVSSVPMDTEAFDETFSDHGVGTESIREDNSSSPAEIEGKGAGEENTNGDDLFSVQVGAFIFDRNLDVQIQKLEEHGFTHHVDETKRVVLMFCPIVSEGLSKNRAETLMKRFPADIVDPVMLPSGKDTYDVTAGLFYYREDAEAIVESLKSEGYDPTIEERTVDVVIKRLRVGYYEEIELARTDSRLLEKLGYDPIIVKVQK